MVQHVLASHRLCPVRVSGCCSTIELCRGAGSPLKKRHASLPERRMQVAFDTRGADGAAPPLEFATGMNEVPEAVDMAVRLMTPQETSLVRAQPRFAYAGREDRPPVRGWRSLLSFTSPA